MKILAKMLISFIAVAALCAIVGIVGLTQLGILQQSVTELSSQTIPALDYLNRIDSNLKDIKVTIRSMCNPLSIDDAVTTKRYADNIANYRAQYAEAKKAYEALPKEKREQELYEITNADFTAAIEYNNTIIALVESAKTAESEERSTIFSRLYAMVSGEKRLVYDTLQADLRALLDYDQQYYGVEIPQKTLKQVEIARISVLVITVLSFVVALILGVTQGIMIASRLKKTTVILDKIAQGDLTERLEIKTSDEFMQVANSLNGVRQNVLTMVGDTVALVKSALAGELSARADATKHQGDYRKIVEGINATLDAVVSPLNVAADYIDKISRGDLPERITATYNGDFNKIKENLNVAIDSIKALIADANLLAEAAIAGNLQTRADASRHQGDYRKIVEGVNTTLDLVITPVNETIAVFKHLAEGDLTARMDGAYRGDFDILKTALNDSLDAINDTLSQINVAVEQVAEGSVQVSQASQALSQGATEQAASLEEITSSTTEISSQTRQNTENALKMNTLAKGAQGSAEKGNAQMKDLVSAMSDINTSAEEIKKVVKTIDDISFQINLLALNANVEAARAGKYGKGFAVVAEEVRNLAVRSANSVKDTTRMVDEAISNIQRGNALVDGTAKQLDEIVGGAGEVSTLAEEVATAGREQTQGLEQIALGLNQIDQVTQSNTASAEESASASEELSSQAQQVKSMLSRFKTKTSESKASSAEIIAMLKAELASRDQPRKAPIAAPAGATATQAKLAAGTAAAKRSPTGAGKGRVGINPSDIISLDDGNFGKF